MSDIIKKEYGSLRNADYSPEDDKISLMDFIYVLAKHRWLIIGSTVTAALLIVLFMLFSLFLPEDSKYNPLPNVYKSRVRILLTWVEMQTKISSLGYDLGIRPSVFLNPLLPNPYLELINGMLYGNTVLDQIAEEFDIYNRFNLMKSKQPKTEAREKIKKALSIYPITQSPAPLFYIFEISYTSEDRVFATQVANRVVEILEENFRKMVMEQIYNKEEFIRQRIQAVEQQTEASKQAIFAFQKKYGPIDLSVQAKEQNSLITELRSDIIKKELEISTLSEYSRANDPRIVLLRNEIKIKDQLISQLKSEFTNEFVPLDQVPRLSAELKELEQSLRMQEEIYRVLKKEYETVRIEESKNLKNFQILEPAMVPERRDSPRRSIICMVVTLSVFFLAIFWAFIKEYIERVGRHPVESEKLNTIKQMIKIGKNKNGV